MEVVVDVGERLPASDVPAAAFVDDRARTRHFGLERRHDDDVGTFGVDAARFGKVLLVEGIGEGFQFRLVVEIVFGSQLVQREFVEIARNEHRGDT